MRDMYQSEIQKKIERRPAPRTTCPFELIHSDLCGPFSPKSVSGLRHFILYIDDYCRSTWVYFLRSKNAVDVDSVFQEYMAFVEKCFPEYPITRFRCDNGRGEYDNSLFQDILRVSGIYFEPSPPYTQDKNGVSERMIRTIVTKARAMLLDSWLGERFWAEAVNTAVYLHYRSSSRTVGGLTPHGMLYGRKPELAHLRRFGCIATIWGNCRSVVQGGPEHSCSTKGGHGPSGPPDPLRSILIHTFSNFNKSVDQGGSGWTRRTRGTISPLGGPGLVFTFCWCELIPDAQCRGKSSERAKKCGFIGYVHQTSKIWRLWDPERKRIVQESNVRFDETDVIGDRAVTRTQLDILLQSSPLRVILGAGNW